MNKRMMLLGFIALSVCCAACTQAANQKGEPFSGTSRNTVIVPDEKVLSLMGDSIANIVFSPKNVVAYKMAPTESPTDNDQTIGGVKIGKQVGIVGKNYYPVMQFMLADSMTYSGEAIIPAVPFKAMYALEFKQKKESVSFLFSFVSREISAIKNGKEIWHYHVGSIRQMVLFFYNLTHDEDLLFYLKK